MIQAPTNSSISYKVHYPPMLKEKDGSPGWVWHATYKGVFMELGADDEGRKDGKPWVSIFLMESKNKNKGECQEMIDLIREDFPGRILCASVPLNPTAQHIFDKKKVDYSMEEEEE